MVKTQETISVSHTTHITAQRVIAHVVDTSEATIHGASAVLSTPEPTTRAAPIILNMPLAIAHKARVVIVRATTRVGQAAKVMPKVAVRKEDTTVADTDSVRVVQATILMPSIATRSAWNTKRRTMTPMNQSV